MVWASNLCVWRCAPPPPILGKLTLFTALPPHCSYINNGDLEGMVVQNRPRTQAAMSTSMHTSAILALASVADADGRR